MRKSSIVGLAVLLLAVAVASVGAQPHVVGQWTSVQNLPFASIHAHLLPTGKVILWPHNTDPRVWDPTTESVTTPGTPGYNVYCGGHTFLADGRLLVAGGHIESNIGVPHASTYNPLTDTWTRLPNMNDGRWYPTATTLGNGDVLVISGDTDKTVGVNRLPQVLQAGNETWRNLTNAQLATNLYPRMFLAPNGKVFTAGPSATTRYLDTSGTGAWSVVANRNAGYRDHGSAVMYEDGKVLYVGGGDPPTSAAEVIDLNQASPAWRSVDAMAIARRQLNATLLPDGKVLITGGTSGSGFNNTSTPVYAAEMWDPDPARETWSTMASAKIPRLYHSTALLLPDGRVLTTGGNGYPQTEIYSPPYLFTGPRPTIASAPTTVGYGETIFVETPDVEGIAQVTWIRLGSVTHAFNQNQRINHLSFSAASGGLNVETPSSRNLAPPGHYMLFIVDSDGVPSVAKTVRLDSTSNPPSGGEPALTVSATTISTTGAVTTTLSNGPGGATNWLALAPVGSPNTTFLQRTDVGEGVTTRTWTPTTPGPGAYEFRFFLDDSFTRAATSPAVTVTGTTTLSVNATAIPTTGTMTVTLTNGPGGAEDWLALARVGSSNSTYLQWVYVGAGVTTRTWTPKNPGAGSYEFRIFLNDGFTRAATSPTVTVTSGSAATLTVNATTIPPTGTTTVTLTNGPGGATDWLALAPAGSPNTTYLQRTYVGAGVTTRTWTPTTPGPGPYEFRLFLNDGFTRAATSPTVTVTSGGTATLAVNATTIPTTGTTTVTLTNGPGGTKDWLALARVGSSNTTYLQWIYVGAGVTTRTWTPKTPGPGSYEFRLFLNDGFTRAATSPTVTVTSGGAAALTVNATSIPATGTITVTLTNGPGGAKDWLAIARVGSSNTTYLQWIYVGAGVTTRTWTPNNPGPGSYEFRFFLNDGFTRAATSPTVTVNP